MWVITSLDLNVIVDKSEFLASQLLILKYFAMTRWSGRQDKHHASREVARSFTSTRSSPGLAILVFPRYGMASFPAEL
jgi:hypothetical protein